MWIEIYRIAVDYPHETREIFVDLQFPSLRRLRADVEDLRTGTGPSSCAHRTAANPEPGTVRKVVLLVLLIGVFYLSTLRAGQSWDDDFAMYIHHAKNIATGTSYGRTGYIYDTQAAAYGPRTYPPVFPLLLAGVYKVFGLNLTAMKVEIVFLFLAALLAMALVFSSGLASRALLILLALVGFSPFLWNMKESIVSTLPFLFFLYLALGMIHRMEEENRLDTYLAGVLPGIVIYLAYGTRTVGVCLIGALWLRDLVRLRKLSRFSIVATMVFAVGWALQMYFVRGVGSYFDQFRGMPALLSHALTLANSASLLWDNGYSKLLRIAVLVVFSIVAVLGYGWRLRSKVTILETFSVTYILALLLWPTPEVEHIAPLVPLYFFYLLIGLDVVARPPRSIAMLTVFGAIAVSIYFAKYSTMKFGPLSGVEDANAQNLFQYVSTRTKPSDVIVFRRARALSLFTDRSSATYHATRNDGELWNYLCSVHADYIIDGTPDLLDPPKGASSTFLRDFLARNSEKLQQTYVNPEFNVYRIDDGSCQIGSYH
jgi:hypothetical protein